MAYSSSFSSHNWSYDVFPSFSGGDVRKTFMSHFLKELDRKLIIAFKDNEIKKSRSLDPELTKAIKDSRIAVVIFSTNYASSSWCLNELLEIVKCKEECGQVVIPVFYGLDPSHVRKQTGDFGKIFDKTCQNKTEDKIIRWREALTGVANIFGYHSVTWANEAKMVEEIADDVLDKLNLSPSDEFEDFVGIEDHIREMSSLLHLDSKEVKMVGIWGPSGIGKTTIARALFSRLSRRFQNSVFIDKVFISKSMEVHRGANLCDYNMKLHLQRAFLAEVLDKRDIKIDHIGAVGKMLRHRKALIFIDDLDDQDVLEALAGRIQWFGSGSRIIVVTKDKHLLRAHGIDHIYEVSLPSYKLAVEMFCRYAFRKSSPPDGFAKLASEVVLRAGSLPLGLNVLGSSLRGRDVEDWPDMLPRLRNGLDGKIGRTLRVSYNGLNNKKDEAIFRHIACLFNGKEVDHIKMMLADSDLDVHIGLKNLVDKSLVHVREDNVVMHSLLQEMGEEIVHSQSDEPGEREFLIDSKDICHVFENNTGTKKVLGIALNMDTIKTLHVYENAFRRMCNLRFLEFDSQSHYMLGRAGQSHLPENFSYLPSSLKLLCWYGYPMRCMPSKFCPENLVMLKMRISMLEKLWEGVPFTALMTRLQLSDILSLVELPSSIQNLNKLKQLDIRDCKNLETLPTGINLQSLEYLNLFGCSRLRSFPNISVNIKGLDLSFTAIEEVPWWIEKLSMLRYLLMAKCNNLRRVSLNILKLRHLQKGDFGNCKALTEASWDGCPSVVAITTDNIHSRLHDKAGCSISMAQLDFIGCFNFDHKVLFQPQTVPMQVILSGKEVPSYFTHRTTGTSLTNIPLHHISPSQPFIRFKVCALCDVGSISTDGFNTFEIQVCFRFIDISRNYFDHVDFQRSFSSELGGHLFIKDCCVPLNKDITPLAHVDIQFRLIKENSEFKLKGCGILLPENSESLGSQPCNPNILQHVGGGNTSNDAYMGGHETEQSQECAHVCEAEEDNVVNDGCRETEQSHDKFVGSNVEALRNIKRMWVRLLDIFCFGLHTTG
ncbi:hypothetical protein Bca52824_037685 [Brassica carinata]|uniref:ADP-ribosyl cyclase/cyclic ADP-ribose hydrolase n=1 Tax=Brassica carinata TaxID=52824 RepID=A0A8X7UVA9_BRACI|nr:hypothetical protein Bca52824_037685 [Brassica carinata]